MRDRCSKLVQLLISWLKNSFSKFQCIRGEEGVGFFAG